MHGGRLVGVQAPQSADALGRLALVAEGVPDDAGAQVGDVDAFRELDHAGQALRTHGQPMDDTLLPYLSPLGWKHSNLTGDYWRTKQATGKLQPLRPLSKP